MKLVGVIEALERLVGVIPLSVTAD
jgi:hypothetical protein